LRHETNRATLQERGLELEEAKATLLRALETAREHNLSFMLADIHLRIRELCRKTNDFAGYIEHNNEHTRITNEINGKDTAAKLAMQEKQREIDAERKEHEKLLAVLHSTLPKHIAERVARGEVVNDHYDRAAVLFLDIVGFTTISDRLTSGQVVQLLEQVFSALDAVCKRHDVVKIKTIGDSYMAVAFSRESSSSEQRVASIEERAASAALDMIHAVSHIVSPAGSPDGSPNGSPSGSPKGSPRVSNASFSHHFSTARSMCCSLR